MDTHLGDRRSRRDNDHVGDCVTRSAARRERLRVWWRGTDWTQQVTAQDLTLSPDLAYELADAALTRQLDSADAIDTKLASTWALVSGIVAVFGALLAMKPDRSASIEGWFWAAVVLLVAATLLAACGSVLRSWNTGPDVRDVIADLRDDTDPIEVKWWLVNGLIAAAQANTRQSRVKQVSLVGMYVLATGELICLLAAVWALVR
jgi:hypothetical protein